MEKKLLEDIIELYFNCSIIEAIAIAAKLTEAKNYHDALAALRALFKRNRYNESIRFLEDMNLQIIYFYARNKNRTLRLFVISEIEPDKFAVIFAPDQAYALESWYDNPDDEPYRIVYNGGEY